MQKGGGGGGSLGGDETAERLWSVQDYPGDDCVINDTTLLVGDQTVGTGAILHPGHVTNNDGLNKADRILTLATSTVFCQDDALLHETQEGRHRCTVRPGGK